jgi:hypothetical protein
MIQTINVSGFRDAFRAYGRADNFSYEGLSALFNYLEEVDPDFELDVIALCCDYAEETVAQIAENYGLELPANETEKEHADAVRAYLEENTSIVAETALSFLYAQF